MSFVIWTSDGSAVGPLNTNTTASGVLTIRNDGETTVWLANDTADANNGPIVPSTGAPRTNAPLSPGETLTVGVEAGESYYYGSLAPALGRICLRVWSA